MAADMPPIMAAVMAAVMALPPAGAARAAGFDFDIALSFTGGDALQRAAVTEAASFWTSTILGYRGDARFGPYPIGAFIPALPVSVTFRAMDGAGGALAYGAPTHTATPDNGVAYSYAAQLVIDSADAGRLLAAGALDDLARHELAHAIGFGLLWEVNGLATPGSGAYRGPAALARWREAIDPGAAFVPVARGVGAGSDDYHWDEAFGGLSAAWSLELMTPLLGTETFTSNVTIAAFADLGYEVALLPAALAAPAATQSPATPETPVATTPVPGAGALLPAALAAGGGLVRRSRRRPGAAAADRLPRASADGRKP